MNVDGDADRTNGISSLRNGIATGLRKPGIDPQTGGPSVTPSVPWSLSGLFAGFGLLTVGNGLFQTLIPLHMVRLAAPTFVIGLIQSCYYLGFVVGAVTSRKIIERIGQHRTFICAAALVSIIALIFAQCDSPAVLAGLRLLSGLAFVALYMSIESWLHISVENRQRGQIFGAYAAINYLAAGIGQLMLIVGNASHAAQFSIVGALAVSAIVPVALLDGWPVTAVDAVAIRKPSQHLAHTFVAVAKSTRLALPGCILGGMLYSAIFSMTPLFLEQKGYDNTDLAIFMAAVMFGAWLPQWPIGRLSDRFDRRRIIATIAAVSAGLSVILLVWSARPVVWVVYLTYSAVTLTLYSLNVSHINDCTAPGSRVAVSGILLVLFSLGGVLGPPVIAVLMTWAGPSGLFVFNAVIASILYFAAVCALRSRQQGNASHGR
nr:MFS transporter [Caballeronia sp. GAWG2-1]